MAERKRAQADEWERFAKDIKHKRMQKPKSDNTKEIGSHILKNKELIVQPLESEPSGKAQKYERSGPQEFVPFEQDEVSIDNIKKACIRHFSRRNPIGMSCDVLASDRGPSCTKMSHLPNFKLIHIRFLKSVSPAPTSCFKPSITSLSISSLRRKGSSLSVRPHLFAASTLSLSVLPPAIATSTVSVSKQHESLPVSHMLRVRISDFLLSSMEWGNNNTIGLYIDEEPFASGAFRGAYKARISSTEKGKTYVIKKYLQGTYDELAKIGESPDMHAKKSVQMHMLAKYFADQLRILLRLCYNKASYGLILKSSEVVTVEDYVDGSFTKYINNDGTISKSIDDGNALQMAECLTHFSYVKSKDALLLVDIQGCGYTLYDPEIATSKGSFDEKDELLFCIGNLSTVAKYDFFSQHQCNKLCVLADLHAFFEDLK